MEYNNILLNYIYNKITREEAINEVDKLLKATCKIDCDKELKSWLKKTGEKRAVLSKCGKVDKYQVFTDTTIMFATTNYKNYVATSNDYPKCENILFKSDLSKGNTIYLMQLFNACKMAKKDYIAVKIKERVIALSSTVIETAYKISKIDKALLKLDPKKDYSPLYLYTDKELLVICPLQLETKEIDFYINSKGETTINENCDLLSLEQIEIVSAPAPKEEERETNKEKATARQIKYLCSLTGLNKNDFKDLTKFAASRMITECLKGVNYAK